MRQMKKWKIVAWILTAGIAISAAAVVGVRVGIDVGRAQYHNHYVRPILPVASDLVREAGQEDFGNSQFLSLKVQALLVAAGDDAKVSKVLAAEDFSDIEDSGIFTATICYISEPPTHLTVDILSDERFLIDGVEFSGQQITVLAKGIVLRDPEARMIVRADRDVSTESIKKVVQASGRGGITDVLFGAKN